MKRFLAILVMVTLIVCASATAFAYTEKLDHDTVVETTPFGATFPGNHHYLLYAGTEVEVVGWYNEYEVIHLITDGNTEYGTLYIRYAEGAGDDYCNNDYNENGKIVKGVVGDGWQVWARYEPRSQYEDGEEKGDVILHEGDVVEINGDSVYDEQGNKYYPIRMLNKNGYYVQRYVTAKYIDIIVDE